VLWNTANHTAVATIAAPAAVKQLAFSPDGHTLASAGLETSVRLWDVSTGTQLAALQRHTVGVNALAFSPEGSTLITGGADDNVYVWNLDPAAAKSHLCSVLAGGPAARSIATEWKTIGAPGPPPSCR
jgi:WD40 repeat protein